MSGGRLSHGGFSLIELMIAMVLGLLVTAGIIAVFATSSRSDLAQAQLARLQEEGRFAITQIKNDLSMMGGQYCASSGGNAHASAAGPYLDELRAPTVYASGPGALMAALSDVTTPWGSPYPSAPTQPYSLPSFLAMRGYDCTTTICTPMDPSNKKSPQGFSIPAMGTAVDDRVIGAAVITVRYVNQAEGWRIVPEGGNAGSTLVSHADGTLGIKLGPTSDKTNIKDFDPHDPLVMLADCSNAEIFAMSGQGSTELASTGNNFTQPRAFQNMAAPMLFNVSRSFQTVTYFLKVVDNGDGMGHTTGALVRRINGGNTGLRGGSSEEIARGVERLDFKYGVQLSDGTIRYETAEQVDNSTHADCPALPLPIRGNDDRGCLWRSVSLIEVDLLMDGQQPLYTLTPDELAYTYAPDAASDSVLKPQQPLNGDRNVTPLQQGFPLPMLRREFSTVVAVRNFNP